MISDGAPQNTATQNTAAKETATDEKSQPVSAEFSTAQTQDIESMSYERAREELVSVVTKLETGGAPLEESLALWQRGEALADRCERWLDGARTRLEEVRAELSEDS